MLIMQRLAGILFQMQPLDPDRLLTVRQHDGEHALADHRLQELADLIALGQIRVKVVFSGEYGFFTNLSVNSKAEAYGLINGIFV